MDRLFSDGRSCPGVLNQARFKRPLADRVVCFSAVQVLLYFCVS
jgi:hypothetical protein